MHSNPEKYMPQLQEKLISEIERCKANKAAPSAKFPMESWEYADEMRGLLPNDEQRERFIEAMTSDSELMEVADGNVRVLPVLMSSPHDGAVFEDDRKEMYGYLYYYVIDESNRVVGHVFHPAYLDAVFPQEVIANAVSVPENLTEPEAQKPFYDELRKSVDHLLEIVEGS